MTIPFPYNATAGVPNDPAEPEIIALYSQMAWIARLSNEMNGAAELNLKRVFQLVLHMRKYRSWFSKLDARRQREGVSQDPDWAFNRPAGQIGAMIRGFLMAEKMTWASQAAMLTDLAALNTNCGTFADWIEANAVEYKNGYTTATVVGTDADGVPIVSDTAITSPMPAAFQTRVAALRANFN